MNVYKLAYLLIEKGPNVFVVYRERGDEEVGENGNVGMQDVVDVGEWVGGLQVGLEELVMKRDNLQQQQQYEIKMHNFITAIGVFNTINTTNTTTSPISLTSIKLTPIYHNISLNQ